MNDMPRKGILTGIILIALGFLGYFGGGMASLTAFIPSVFGLLIFGFSKMAQNPDKLKMGMHLAAVFGLLGVIMPLGRLIPVTLKGNFVLGLPTISMILMVAVCLWFVIQCVKSFKEARRAKSVA